MENQGEDSLDARGTGMYMRPGFKYKAVRDHPKGCRLKLLAKLLSFEGSKIDVNKRAHLVTGQRSRV